jgi:hypothetical protein
MMNTVAPVNEIPVPVTRSTLSTITGSRRFGSVCVAASILASIPYLWVLCDLWNGSFNLFRTNNRFDRNPMYDLQARALMHGHLWLPNGSIGWEAFDSNGHQYTYFGVFPSLLRVPIFLVTSSFDGRLFAPSILAAWVVTAVFCALLLWRLRVLLRGDTALGWVEAASYAVLLFSILAGSTLIYLASSPDVFSEDEAWSVALAIGSLFALVGIIERPSWRRIVVCGILVLLTDMNRTTTGYSAVLAMLLVAGWYGLGRAGRERRHWAAPIAVIAVVVLAVGCAIDFAKFGLLFGVPFSDQELFGYFALQRINGGHYLSLHWLPNTLNAYINPTNIDFSSVFPYIFRRDVPSTLFGGNATAGIPVSMPFLFVAGFWGAVTSFTPGRPTQFRALRLLLLSAAVPAAVIMIYGWIFERFVADFVPLLVLAAMVGVVDLWNRMGSVSRNGRKSLLLAGGAMAVLGFWANMSFALVPTNYWNAEQGSRFIEAQLSLSDVTGHPLAQRVVVGSKFPAPAPLGTVFVRGHCAALYIAYHTVRPGTGGFFYLQVEKAPHTPTCHSLVG